MSAVVWRLVLAALSAGLVSGTGEWTEDAEDLGKCLSKLS